MSGCTWQDATDSPRHRSRSQQTALRHHPSPRAGSAVLIRHGSEVTWHGAPAGLQPMTRGSRHQRRKTVDRPKWKGAFLHVGQNLAYHKNRARLRTVQLSINSGLAALSCGVSWDGAAKHELIDSCSVPPCFCRKRHSVGHLGTLWSADKASIFRLSCNVGYLSIKNKKSELMLMRRARANSSSCSQVILVYLYPFRRISLFCRQKIVKKLLKTNIFKVQGHLRSSTLTFLRISSLVLVIISSMSVHICNYFHARQANNG